MKQAYVNEINQDMDNTFYSHDCTNEEPMKDLDELTACVDPLEIKETQISKVKDPQDKTHAKQEVSCNMINLLSNKEFPFDCYNVEPEVNFETNVVRSKGNELFHKAKHKGPEIKPDFEEYVFHDKAHDPS